MSEEAKPLTGAAFNALMEEETKESLIAMLLKAWSELREARTRIAALEEGLAPFAAYTLGLSKLGRPAPRSGGVYAISSYSDDTGALITHELKVEDFAEARALLSPPVEAPSDCHPQETGR